jgi:hypothetical protein
MVCKELQKGGLKDYFVQFSHETWMTYCYNIRPSHLMNGGPPGLFAVEFWGSKDEAHRGRLWAQRMSVAPYGIYREQSELHFIGHIGNKQPRSRVLTIRR